MTLPRLLVLLALLGGSACAAGTAASPADNQALVEQFVAAFNRHDADAMAKLVDENVQWLSVSADNVAVEVEGRAALETAMKNYFESCKSCRSVIAATMDSGQRVIAVEVASWESESGLQSQQAVAIYEFSGSLIHRVYYYPSEPVVEVRLSRE